MDRSTHPRLFASAPLLMLVLAAGCASGRYPVNGRVTYEDGSPVEAGPVIGEAEVNGKLVGAQGNIAPDGTFSWGTKNAGDGALPGDYRVAVMPVALGDSELAEGKQPAVDGKFTRYESSGLTFEVKAGPNELNITVTRPKPRSRTN